MTDSPLAFVDIETTGTNPIADRIIEIGIVRVDPAFGKVRMFESLVDPQALVSPFIEKLTGINQRELEKAPSFYEVKDEIYSFLDGCIFVAHNVRFDYGFLRHEFRRHRITFSSKQMCTVKLSRKLYPRYKKHNLSTIVERFGFECKRRHRALDDARVLWDFYRHACNTFSQEKIESVVSEMIRNPSIPVQIKKQELEKLTDTPGVYTFFGDRDTPLYIGKSLSVRDRVMSHFSNDQNSRKSMEMCQQIIRIEVENCAGDLGAQLLESKKIKCEQPLYNRALRRARKLVVLKKTCNADGYFVPTLCEVSSLSSDELDTVLGVFRSVKQAKDQLLKCAQEHSLCQKLLGIEKGNEKCFFYHLGYCRGGCFGKESPLSYNIRFSEAFSKYKVKSWPYDGVIVIKEQFEDREEVFFVYRWCLIASYKNEPDFSEFSHNQSDSYEFDYDAYKILLRYIMNPRNQQTINVLAESNSADT